MNPEIENLREKKIITLISFCHAVLENISMKTKYIFLRLKDIFKEEKPPIKKIIKNHKQKVNYANKDQIRIQKETNIQIYIGRKESSEL